MKMKINQQPGISGIGTLKARNEQFPCRMVITRVTSACTSEVEVVASNLFDFRRPVKGCLEFAWTYAPKTVASRPLKTTSGGHLETTTCDCCL
jgi:hypothetical protein